MSLLRKRILPTLAILVVACAQVFGMQRGFVCDHHGTAVETVSEHCHLAGSGEAEFVPCDEDGHKDCSGQEDPKSHAPLTLQLQTSTAGLAGVTVPVFVAVLVTEIQDLEWLPVQTFTENEMMKVSMDTGDESPPAALQVARCVVILV